MEKVADSFGLSASESIQPRLRANDLLLATDREARSVLQIRRGAGYAQFGGFSLAVQGGYTVSKAEFERRRAAPWPDPNERSAPCARPAAAELSTQQNSVESFTEVRPGREDAQWESDEQLEAAASSASHGPHRAKSNAAKPDRADSRRGLGRPCRGLRRSVSGRR